MYAVIETGGKQYTVKEGDVLSVERLDAETKTITQVLAIGGNDEPVFGTPIIAGASVTIEVLEEKKDKKIRVFKMKKRKSFRRDNGHRQIKTIIKVTAINA